MVRSGYASWKDYTESLGEEPSEEDAARLDVGFHADYDAQREEDAMGTTMDRAAWIERGVTEIAAQTGEDASVVRPLLEEAVRERERQLGERDRAEALHTIEMMKKHLEFMVAVVQKAPDGHPRLTFGEAWRRHEFIDLVRLMVAHKVDPDELLLDLEAEEAVSSGDPRDYDARYDDPTND